MSWSAALNLVLGLVLVYLVFSIAASRINEFVASKLQWRARGLERALHAMLGDPPADADDAVPGAGAAAPAATRSVATSHDGTPVDATTGAAAPAGTAVLSAGAVKDHPIVAVFESAVGKNRRISYLPSRAFSSAVLDILAPPALVIIDSIDTTGFSAEALEALAQLRLHPDSGHLAAFEQALPADSPLRTTVLPRLHDAVRSDVLEQARAAVLELPPSSPARRPLLRMLTDAADDRDVFRAKLEHWYDDEMSRLTGWYKRHVQRFIIGYGLLLAVVFNVDTISIADTLWRSPVVQAAAAQAAADAAGKSVAEVDTGVAAVKGLAVPLGWTPTHDGTKISADPRHVPEAAVWPWALKLLGLAVTGFALAFGTPFWFDVLGKFARLRNSGGVVSSSPDSGRK